MTPGDRCRLEIYDRKIRELVVDPQRVQIILWDQLYMWVSVSDFEVSWPMKPRSFNQWNDALAWTTPPILGRSGYARRWAPLMAFWGVPGVDKSNDDVPSISFPTKTGGKQLLFKGTRKKQKVQTFLCCGFAGVNILGGCVSKLRAPKTSSICYQNSDNLRCYLRATYASWN